MKAKTAVLLNYNFVGTSLPFLVSIYSTFPETKKNKIVNRVTKSKVLKVFPINNKINILGPKFSNFTDILTKNLLDSCQ